MNKRYPDIAKPWSDTQRFTWLSRELLGHPALIARLAGTRHRLVALEEIHEPVPAAPPARRFRATFYDYSRGKTVHATGPFDHPAQLTIAD